MNRDLEKAQEITRDEKTSVTVYVNGAAIEEVISGGEGIKGNVKKLVDAYEAFTTDLSEETKSKLDSKVEGLGESAEDNMKEMIRNGVDPDVAQALLSNEQYQQQLVNAAKIEAQYQKNPEEFLKQCGIELKEGETAADAKEISDKGWQWLASLSEGGSTETDDLASEDLDGERLLDNPYRLTKKENGEWGAEITALQKTLDNGEALRTILTLVDNSGGFDYQVTDGTALVLQGLQDARKFIDSIPADDIKMVQAATLGMQLATGGPAKIVLGYAVAMAAKALVGDQIEATKALVSEEVAAFLQSGALSSDEYKALNCPNGDCSDKYASAGSYAINMDKDNVKFGLNIIIGVVGNIVNKKISAEFKKKYGIKLSYDKETKTWTSPAGLVYGDIAVRLRTVGIRVFPHERWLSKLRPYNGHV